MRAFGQLQDILLSASLTATAMHAPEKLEQERTTLLDIARRLEQPRVEPGAIQSTSDAVLAQVELALRVARRNAARGLEPPPLLKVLHGD